MLVTWELTNSNYPPAKLEENMTAEIMQTCLTESRESYAEEIIVELQSDGEGDAEVEENVRRIAEWCEKWRQDRLAGNHDD
jgi:adenylate kinase